MPHLAGRKNRLFRDFESRQAGDCPNRLDAWEIGRGEHRVPMLRRNCNPANAAMRDGTAQESDIPHAGEADVGNVLATPTHQAVVFFARQTGADSLGCQPLFAPSVHLCMQQVRILTRP
jgi:hypothetical protein